MRSSRSLLTSARSLRSSRPLTIHGQYDEHDNKCPGEIGHTFDICYVPLGKFRPIVNEPLHTFLETRETVDCRWLEDECCIQWDESDKTAHGQLHRVTGPKLDRIVVQAVLFIPKTEVVVITITECHGIGNEDKMLKEFRSDIFIDRVVFC